MERTQCPPWGLAGGLAGEPGRIEVCRAGDAPVVVTKKQVPLLAGDLIRVFTAGGGGYGPPDRRPRAAVAEDVAQGLISEAAAREVYDYKP